MRIGTLMNNVVIKEIPRIRQINPTLYCEKAIFVAKLDLLMLIAPIIISTKEITSIAEDVIIPFRKALLSSL